jgi:CopG-like RHH_1 or ribbon-helix-helix domain, RHH_5
MINPTSVRVPAALRARLSARATAEGRTLSNLMIVLLDDALAARTATLPPAEHLFIRRLRETCAAEDTP